ncbi:YhcN/YlaJ family sporulation lipoprotein [Ammoniphilus sp. 3BR4]|uniref:YhcN/YlaJ family sporulation lipoprotein n=1 Tax=Ammoniphilus sp. 3BR4 TaxID=3158265 RepID=UPI0034677333
MIGLKHKLILPILSIGLLTACGFDDGVRTNQKTIPGEDRHLVKEYDSYRSYTYNNGSVKARDLATRLSNEAERVYNVAEAVAIVEGKDIILALSTKTDPIEPSDEVVKRVRQRLMNKEPGLTAYNLYITTDQELSTRIAKTNNNLANRNTPGYPSDASEPDFAQILRDVRTSLAP